MRVIITGGCGFLGQMLAQQVMKKGFLQSHGLDGESAKPVNEILLADVARPPRLLLSELEEALADGLLRVVIGDVSDESFCVSLFEGASDVSVFHLGAVKSGQGEAGFDLCLRVNLVGTMRILEAGRASTSLQPRFILTSAGATILGAGHARVRDMKIEKAVT